LPYRLKVCLCALGRAARDFVRFVVMRDSRHCGLRYLETMKASRTGARAHAPMIAPRYSRARVILIDLFRRTIAARCHFI
jgi:hypothetical protein